MCGQGALEKLRCLRVAEIECAEAEADLAAESVQHHVPSQSNDAADILPGTPKLLKSQSSKAIRVMPVSDDAESGKLVDIRASRRVKLQVTSRPLGHLADGVVPCCMPALADSLINLVCPPSSRSSPGKI